MATITQQTARSGRGIELVMLALGLGIGLYAYLQVGLATTGSPPAGMLTHGGVLAALALLAHVALRWRARYADPVILPTAVALNGIGLAMIYRLDHAYALREMTTGFANRQVLWTVIGMLAAVVILVVLRDHRTLRRYTYLSMIAGLVLLLLPLLPIIGNEINGARIWISVGPMSFQPAELAKVFLAIFFAGYLVTNRDTLALAGPRILGLQLPRIRDLGPILLAWAVALVVLVFQRDLGAALLFFALFVAMLYVATERLSWVLIGLTLFGAGAALAATTFGHVGARFAVWLDALSPEMYNRNPGGSGQLVNGLFGMASGGLMGTGWGEGRPDLVPYANSDFIIASLGEELGLTGVLAILLMYLVLAQRGMRAAIGVRDGFGKLLASGLSFVVAFQIFVVVGGVTRLIPLTGLTTPFLAQGGSALVVNWMIIALLLRISDSARRPAPLAGDLPVGPIAPGGSATPVTFDSVGDDSSPTEVVRLT
ncbi:FtsW/RodA/SpoVE family cell cycle protein [Georgenia sp. MJ173]|uniref:FtsW/RodA/SpoVE family cell cycle protein n=1 Tax=Georgenia sunbinii TaxID=3117728 RepID=UPI002F2612E7